LSDSSSNVDENKSSLFEKLHANFLLLSGMAISIFVFLDILTIVNIFHFKNSFLTQTYFPNLTIASAPFMLIAIFFPIILILLLPIVSLISVFVAKKISMRRSVNKLFERFVFPEASRRGDNFLKTIAMSVGFNLITVGVTSACFGWIGADFELIWLYLLIPIPVLILGLIVVFPFLNCQRMLGNRSAFDVFGAWSIGIFLLIALICILIPFKYQSLFLSSLLLLTVPFVLSVQLLGLELNTTAGVGLNFNIHLPKEIKISAFVIFMILLVGGANVLNKSVWGDTNLSNNTSFNLHLNKLFLNVDGKNIDLNLSEINSSKCKGFDRNSSKHKNIQYLPFTSDIGFYFFDSNDSKQKTILALQKTDVGYEVLGVGCLDKKTVR